MGQLYVYRLDVKITRSTRSPYDLTSSSIILVVYLTTWSFWLFSDISKEEGRKLIIGAMNAFMSNIDT